MNRLRSNGRPPRSGSSDEATQRLENGGYTDAEMNAALLRSQRSDPMAVALRLATLAVVYGLLANGIREGLTAPYLLIPLLAELLLIFWSGWLMSRFVIDCKAFRRSAGSGIGVAIWSALILGGALAWIAWDAEAARLDLGGIVPRAEATLGAAREYGVHWALLAMALGLLTSTTSEVARWRRERGVFVWTSITTAGTRIGLLIVLGMLVGILAGVLSPIWQGSGLERWLSEGTRLAWLVWSVLLVLDAGVVIVLALMHRDLKAGRG